MSRLRAATFVLGAIALGLAAFLWGPDLAQRFDRDRVQEMVAMAGMWGPALIIGLMMLSVVASPIPSAPIALASGAAYGQYIGTIYVATGAELGAMVAFLIARILGRDAVNRMLGEKVDYGLLGSQNALMFTVFATRLMPFISFDAMSYAAGLSQLHLWRFLVATLAGILPASFVLAHFGEEAMSGDYGMAQWLTIGLGVATMTPLVLIALGKGRAAWWRGKK